MRWAPIVPLNPSIDGQFRLTLDETKPRGGRPPNPLIPRLMAVDGVSRATAYRRLKAKHEAQLARGCQTRQQPRP
jgi:hypothetical protein